MSSGLNTPNRVRSKSPARSKSPSRLKSPAPCDNVEQEFSNRFMQLFTSFYETPTADPILTFPPVSQKGKKNSTSSQVSNDPKGKITNPQQPPFNAAVWDLRLRKAVEARQNNEQKATESMTENTVNMVDDMNLNISQKTQNDLTDVFQPEKAERPEVPKYLQNIEAEQKEEIRERKNRKKARPLNLSEVDKQFKARQQKLKQRDAEHQKKLKDRQLQQERSHKEFLSSLPKTKHAEEVRKEAAATVKADNKLRKELLNNLRKTSPRSVNSRSKSPAGHSNFNLSEEIMLGNNGRSPPGSPNGLYSEEYE